MSSVGAPWGVLNVWSETVHVSVKVQVREEEEVGQGRKVCTSAQGLAFPWSWWQHLWPGDRQEASVAAPEVGFYSMTLLLCFN